MTHRSTFWGFVRADSSVGIRNHVAVIPTVACVNAVARSVEKAVPGCVALMHGHGCGRALELAMHQDVLAGLALNPNVAGAVFIALGCETINAGLLAERVRQAGKPVEVFVVQKEGGSVKTAQKACDAARSMVEQASRMERVECPVEAITLGLECGGSDAFSGITANPAVGLAADWFVEQGATVILTESTEMIGTAHILSRRATSPDVAKRLVQVIDDAERRTKEILGPLASLVIAPGNMDGGMTTIQEKSLGCICKAGSSPIEDVVGYGQRPSRKGLVVMDGPGYDMESLTGLASAGCQIILFTTGRGTPAGFPLVPVVKIASTSALFASMSCDMDIDAGPVLKGLALESVADSIIDYSLGVMDGRPTKAEQNDVGFVVCLYTMTPSF